MEEQTPFCPSCRAPQIRVSSRTDPQEPTEPESLNTPPPPYNSELTRFPAISADFSPAQRILWKKFFRIVLPMTVLVGASAAAIPPLGLLIFLPASVVLGIHLYRRQQLGPIKASLGARMGAFTGLLSFAFFLIGFALKVISHQAEFQVAYREIVAKALQDAAARTPDPEMQQAMQSLFSGTSGMLLLAAVLMGFALIFFLIIAGVTGALTATSSSGKKTL